MPQSTDRSLIFVLSPISVRSFVLALLLCRRLCADKDDIDRIEGTTVNTTSTPPIAHAQSKGYRTPSNEWHLAEVKV